MPGGRPSSYTPEIAAEICKHLASPMSLRKICEADDMPCKETVRNWLNIHPEFLAQYARAREEQADVYLDEIIEIADDGTNDFILRERNGREEQIVDQEHINRSRLRVDARKWAMSKLAPKKYGDKLDTTISGPDGAAVAVNVFLSSKPTPPSEAE